MEGELIMRHMTLACLVILFYDGIGLSQAYRPKNKAIVSFHTVVTVDSVNRFRYTYNISNNRNSQGICDEFTVLVVDSLLTSDRTEIASSKNKKWYIDGGVGSIYGDPATRFLDIPPENGLAPGESITISFTSPGLPSIMIYYAESFAPPLSEQETDSLLQSGYTMDQLFPDWKRNSYKNLTVAPNTDLLNLPEAALLDTLISYKHQCVALGWLRDDKPRERECEETMRGKDWYMKEEGGKMRSWEVDESWDFDRDWNNGIIGVLDKRLEMAKKALMRGDSVGARRNLQIFVVEVELVNRLGEKQEDRGQKTEVRGQKPVMTSEAYALLKYNAEYLIDRLPERQGKPPEERREGRRWEGEKLRR